MKKYKFLQRFGPQRDRGTKLEGLQTLDLGSQSSWVSPFKGKIPFLKALLVIGGN